MGNLSFLKEGMPNIVHKYVCVSVAEQARWWNVIPVEKKPIKQKRLFAFLKVKNISAQNLAKLNGEILSSSAQNILIGKKVSLLIEVF
jgi:hypothetical protein